MEDKTLKNILRLLEQEKFKVDVYKKYGRYFIEFEMTGYNVRDIKKFIEYLPERAVITSSHNRSFCVDTNINIK